MLVVVMWTGLHSARVVDAVEEMLERVGHVADVGRGCNSVSYLLGLWGPELLLSVWAGCLAFGGAGH